LAGEKAAWAVIARTPAIISWALSWLAPPKRRVTAAKSGMSGVPDMRLRECKSDFWVRQQNTWCRYSRREDILWGALDKYPCVRSVVTF
jgi:hypothetical protein